MATWFSNYLASLGLGSEYESYFTSVFYDPNLTEEDKSATIYECLEECNLENINIQDAVAELFDQYTRGGLFWMEAPIYTYPTSTFDIQYPTRGNSRIPIVAPNDTHEPSELFSGTNGQTGQEGLEPWARPTFEIQFPRQGNSRIPIVRPDDKLESSVSPSSTDDQISQDGPETWARIDDDEDPSAYAPITVNSQFVGAPRDTLDPFDDDEFNPFAPPSASDAAVINVARSISYPPPIFYSSEGDFDFDDNSSVADQDMTPLEMLQHIIGDFSPEKIEKAFEKNGYDFENTLEMLMAERTQQPVFPVPMPVGDVRSTQTCRHFLQGNCFRKDCWYSHDLDSMVCKFWLKSQCLKGETCEFNHYLDTSRKFVVPEPAPKQLPPVMDENDFPSLAASTSTKSKGASAWGTKTKGSKDMQKSKPNSMDASALANTSTTAVGTTAADDKEPAEELATLLNTKAVIAPPHVSTPLKSYSATAAAAASKPLTTLQKSSVEEQRQSFKLLQAPESVPWLETGSVLNETYLKARAQAIEYAKARNNCFEKAKNAYNRNDTKGAAKYSAQGREYNDLMMATHREASREIFDHRNGGGMIKSVTKGETWIDLHGLHINESLAFLDEFMERLENEAYTGTVFIVTGTGHHSYNSRAKLKPAIIDWLDSWGYVWKEMTMDKVTGGLIAVQVIRGKA
ncbi:hypothetical protein FBU30_010343 [Linnemannia zychae]|nr:hypothetical protein FBU30_010343 [Linnemannia zychae]